MKTDQSQRKYLKEYTRPQFTITKTELDFSLEVGQTTVRSQLQVQRLTEDLSAPLILDGVDLQLIEIMINDTPLEQSQYSYDGELLTLSNVPDKFTFQATVVIDPASNTRLEGLYQSSGNYCTQCEAEGFRHITFYLDRPDVMSVFTTTIHADAQSFPVLLSNGNKLDSGGYDERHWVKWHDPYPKPCYLFALVAGDLACVSGQFTTMSGRNVALEFYTEHHNRDKCDHALQSLQKAMQWDEQVFGLEYDLDLYMVVAVDDFNMGAMENKGLNVFNTQYVLANQQTATDDNYLGIEGVIAHEYFHNWTGNRVTCRDWFQLSLKEGLTVFRDQEFSSDMNSRAIQRINDVRGLRSFQFAEDAGPMAHPIRPSSYLEINNFYTVTVYEKGAEVVRIYHTLLGQDGFRKGMDLYFQRHDGQAVTTDDFRMAMQDANDVNLDQFQCWYEQSGTPVVKLKRIYDDQSQILKLQVTQDPGKTKSVPNQPFHIPLRLSLFDATGQAYSLNQQGDTELVLDVLEQDQTFEFENIAEYPLLSAFRGFSAPVIIESDLTQLELAQLMSIDTDPFNQWDAGQQYATQVLLELIHADELSLTDSLQGLLAAFSQILDYIDLDLSLMTEMLLLPGEKYLSELCTPVDVHRIHRSREFVKDAIAAHCESQFLSHYQSCQTEGDYQITPQAMGQRSLKNSCLAYLTRLHQPEYHELALAQFQTADNMTDQLGSLSAMVDEQGSIRNQMFEDFYQQWADTPLVVDKWFRLQASVHNDQALELVKKLEHHPAFNLKNPNRVRSLLGPFQHNVKAFHHESGQGYEFLADKILQLDSTNPQIASRMAHAFLGWKKLVPEQGGKMKRQIERIHAKPGLSNDVAELMASSLADES